MQVNVPARPRSARWLLALCLFLGLLPLTALAAQAGTASPPSGPVAVAAADDSGTTVLTGSLTASDAQQKGRVQRDGQTHGCELPGTPMPQLENDTVVRRDSHQLANEHDEARCIVVEADLSQCGGSQTQVTAYSTFNPAAPASNVLGASGFSSVSRLVFGFRVGAGASFTIVVNEVDPGQLCSSYAVTVTNAPLAAVINRVEGPSPSDIAGQVYGFKNVLGAPADRREITWDDVPEAAADPALLPADYYNTTQRRGLVFTGGSQAKVSSDGSGVTPAEFGGLSPDNAARYQPFSGVRLMAPKPDVADIAFRIAGTAEPAPTSAFAAVLVSPGTAGYLMPRGQDGSPLGIYVPPAQPNGLGFYGIRYAKPAIWSMSLTADRVKGSNGGTVFDDFIYADPGVGLSVATTGPGRVTGPGVSCPSDCTAQHAPGPVTLTAVPTGPAGVRWGGACAPAGTARKCVVALSEEQAVSAKFVSCQQQKTKVTSLKKVVSKKRAAVAKAKRALRQADRPGEVAAAKAALTKAQRALKQASRS